MQESRGIKALEERVVVLEKALQEAMAILQELRGQSLEDHVLEEKVKDIIAQIAEENKKDEVQELWYEKIPKRSRWCSNYAHYGHVADECFFRPFKSPAVIFFRGTTIQTELAPALEEHSFTTVRMWDNEETDSTWVGVGTYGERAKLIRLFREQPYEMIRKPWRADEAPQREEIMWQLKALVKKFMKEARTQKRKQRREAIKNSFSV